MASTKVCTVCTHPDRVAIDAAIGAGTPLRSVAIQYPPLTYGSISRHARNCVKVRPSVDALKRSKVAAAAIQQVERATLTTLRERAESELERSADLAALSEKVARLVTDKAIENAAEGTLGGDALYETLAAIKGAVEARGGGMLKWTEVVGRLNGELQSGSSTTINVQLNQRVVILKDAALDWARSELAPTMLDRLERAGLLVDAGRAVDVLTDGIVDATEALEARLDAAKVAEGGKERGNG